MTLKLKVEDLRPDRMSSAERVAALLEGKPIDRVPFTPFFAFHFAAKNAGISLREMYSDLEYCYQLQSLMFKQYGFDFGPAIGVTAEQQAADFGGEVVLPSSEYEMAWRVVRFPVQSVEDAWNLKLPDVKTAGFIPMYMEWSKILDRYGYQDITVTYMVEPFNLAGVGLYLRWVKTNPKVVHHLARLNLETSMNVIKYWQDTFGKERVQTLGTLAGGTNSLVSPEDAKEYDFPYLKELFERAFASGIKRVFCHICGEHTQNLPWLSQLNFGDPGVLSFTHHVDLADAIKYLGDRNIIAGNVSTQNLAYGTPDQVYEECRQCIEKGKKAPRGFVLMTACELPPSTPPANLWAMRKAVNDFGWYD